MACVALLAGPVSADFDLDRNLYGDLPPDDGSGPPAPESPTAVVFDNEADFLNAAGYVTTQDFEAEATVGTCDDGAVPQIAFADFTASSTPDAMKVLDTPCVGNHNTTPGGAKYLSADTDLGGVSAEVTFTFDAPIKTLGLYITDLDSATMQILILGSGYMINPHGNGGESYFGIIEDTEFTTVIVQIVQEYDSHYSFDDISYGTGQTPVEDATWGGVKALYR
jgi:hypothetical protein